MNLFAPVIAAGILLCANITFADGTDTPDISRQYFTEYGVLTLRFAPGGVSGTYAHEDGRIAGALNGNEVKGTWTQGDGSGDIIMTFTPGFETFKARYNHTDTPEKWETDWSGMLKPPLRVRAYATTWGTLSCHFEGSQLSCTYPWFNGRVLGELSGHSFKGVWLQSNHGFGELTVTFADDFGSFKGTYNDLNHHPEKRSPWEGRLIK